MHSSQFGITFTDSRGPVNSDGPIHCIRSLNRMVRYSVMPLPDREPCLLCRRACVGRRWPSLGAVGLCGPALAFHGLLWAFVGRCWCCGPLLACVGCFVPLWACFGRCGPSLAVVGCCGPSWACVGLPWAAV